MNRTALRPLSVAIAMALVLAAGCAAPADPADTQVAKSRTDARAMARMEATDAMSVAPPPPAVLAAPLARAVHEKARVAGETYAAIASNPVQRADAEPVSTFSIDVDTGSYANVRRTLRAGTLPPADAVRAEELVNYFDYDYPLPDSPEQPFSVTTELAPAPWDPQRHLLLVGVKGYEVAPESIPAANIVFLVDTSGSMQSADKLGLLKESLALLVAQLRPQDRLAIVAYAGSAGLVLPSTPGSERGTILAALERLEAGGSTNGGAGIDLAYAVAAGQYLADGVNRVVLATDGDFNVGTTGIDALKQMVEARRDSGIALTTLGFGTGNYNDALAEQLADIGNGNHAYIDTANEGRKVLVDELSSTMLTIASDVKIQLEFDPRQVREYRLVGYENRLLRTEDFDDDRVDAGEIGAGHDVTALYELLLAEPTGGSGRLAELRLRYKHPHSERSELLEVAVRRSTLRAVPGPRLQLAAAVAAFAEGLRGGERLGNWNLSDVASYAARLRAPDPFGYRAEFVELASQAAALQPAVITVAD